MSIRWNLVFTAAITFLFAVAIWASFDLPLGARLAPIVIGVPSVVLCIVQFALDWKKGTAPHHSSASSSSVVMVDIAVDDDFPPDQLIPRLIRSSSWILSFWVTTWLFGFRIAVPLFLLSYLLVEAKSRWVVALGITAGVCLVMFGLFEGVMSLSLPRGIFRL